MRTWWSVFSHVIQRNYKNRSDNRPFPSDPLWLDEAIFTMQSAYHSILTQGVLIFSVLFPCSYPWTLMLMAEEQDSASPELRVKPRPHSSIWNLIKNLYHDVDLPHKIFTFKCLSKWLISEENLHHSIFGKIVVELTEIPPFFPERTLQLVDSRKWHLCGILRRSLPLDVRLTVGRGYRVLSWATGEEHPESLKPIFEYLCHWEDLRTIRGLKSDCRSRENGY